MSEWRAKQALNSFSKAAYADFAQNVSAPRYRRFVDPRSCANSGRSTGNGEGAIGTCAQEAQTIAAASVQVPNPEPNDFHGTASLGEGITVKWIKRILAYVFDCVHRHTTWPQRDRRGLDYVCCLDCGRELPYSIRRMSIVTTEERIEDRAFDRREEFGNAEGRLLPDFFGTRPALPSSVE